MIVEAIDALIGNTPVIKLTELSHELKRSIYLKLEFLNPGGSVKDRIAKSMVEDALKQGRLSAGDTLIEPTSGNTGIGLAMMAARYHLGCVIVMPESVSLERQKIVQGYGAKLVLTPKELGIKGSIAEAERLVNAHGYIMLKQFENPANPKAHETTTALEILDDFDHLDAFVAGSGTGGTITGNGRILKQHFPTIEVVAVEPLSSSVISGHAPGPHKIMGIGPGFVPENLDTHLIDQIIRVPDEAAFETARTLAKDTGIFGGISTGANLYAAIEVAKRLPEGSSILSIACSNAERYLSTELFDPYAQ